MKVLLTGASDTTGLRTFQEVLRQAHNLSCFDKWGRRVEKKVWQVECKVRVISGDLHCSKEVAVTV